MDQDWSQYRRLSRGWMNDNPAYIHPRILFGPGIFIDEEFVDKHKIKYVINCTAKEETPKWFLTKYPKNFACMPFPDTLETDIIAYYPSFELILNNFLKSDGVVYIHCQCGINRSGFMSVLYACIRLHYQYDDVIKSVLIQRPSALTNPRFKKDVYEYILRTQSKKDKHGQYISNEKV